MISLKSKKLKALAAGLMLTLALGVAGCGGGDKKADNAGKKANVGIVQLVEHDALDKVNKGFVDGLASKGFKEGENIAYDRQNAQADQSNLQNIVNRFINNKVDMIFAIATPSAQTAANLTKDIPIVASAVTDYKTAKLVKDVNKPGTNVTGTTDMNPIKEQVDLLLKIKPDAKVIGTIYCSSEVNSQLQVDILKKAAAEKGLTVKEATVSNVNDIQQAARSILGDVQAIYLPTDNVMASAIPTLLTVTNEVKMPVIAAEAGMVKAGALITLGIDYYKLGFQSGEMASEVLNGKAKVQDMPIQSQKEFQVTVNQKTADAIGAKVPEELLKGAEIIK